MRGLKERYEVHHGVRITDPAVIAAATLSHRHIPDRHLPDKAIDLIDEAAARLRTEIDSKPQELDEVDRAIMQLEIEREALKKEKDKASKERLEKLEGELAELREKSKAITARWQAEKQAIGQLRALKEKLEQTRTEMERAERAADLEKAARLRYGELRALEEQIRAAEAKLKAMRAEGALLKEEVDAEEVAAIVARWTGIPVRQIAGRRDAETPAHGRDACTDRVVGQDGRDSRGLERRPPRPRRSAATRAVPSARSSSSAPPGSARPNWPKPWRSSCSMIGRRHGAAVDMSEYQRTAHRQPSGWRAARLRGLRGRRSTDRVRPPPPLSSVVCSMKSKRRTRKSATSCCKSWTMAA